jgi:hypothetical protein
MLPQDQRSEPAELVSNHILNPVTPSIVMGGSKGKLTPLGFVEHKKMNQEK